MPDLTLVIFRPEVLEAEGLDVWGSYLLGYLRSAGRTRLATLADRMRQPESVIDASLDKLLESGAVVEEDGTYYLAELWRDILPEVITVEAKVSDWQRAVAQAARNRVFSHRAFVALPEPVALRVRSAKVFGQLGLGIVSVSDKANVRIVRHARRQRPRVWHYYYKLAFRVASTLGGT